MQLFDTYESARDYLETLPANTAKYEESRAAAQRCYQSSRDSFDRCDTDGFLSQWASDMTARKHEMEAEIAKHGGQAVFQVLLTLDGTLASQQVWRFPNQFAGYGSVLKWKLIPQGDPRGQTSRWVSYYKKESSYTKKGYRLGWAVAPAVASHHGNIVDRTEQPRGLGGCGNMTYRPRMANLGE